MLDDTDLEKAVKIGVQARLTNAGGQVCTAARFILHEKIAVNSQPVHRAFRKVKVGSDERFYRAQGASSAFWIRTDQTGPWEAVKKWRDALHVGGKPLESKGNCFDA